MLKKILIGIVIFFGFLTLIGLLVGDKRTELQTAEQTTVKEVTTFALCSMLNG